MLDEKKIETEKKYFKEQVLRPTGKYTDFVIRTYYFIYKLCQENKADWCYGRYAGDSKIKNFIYENYYGGKPDHAGSEMVGKIKAKLSAMGYITFKKIDDDWRIYILNKLDFLGMEIEDYIILSNNRQKETSNGEAVEYFEYFNKEGINIYKYQKGCWKCRKLTHVYTYFLSKQLSYAFTRNVRLYDKQLDQNFPSNRGGFLQETSDRDSIFEEIGIGSIEKIDKYLGKKIPSIQFRFSKTMNGNYFMNTCEFCNSIQGINYVVYKPSELFDLEQKDLEKLVSFKVFPADMNLTIMDITSLLR